MQWLFSKVKRICI